MLKKILFILIFTAAFTAQAQNFNEAEKLYQDGDFASAQKQYEPLLKTATGDTLLQTQLRYAACKYSLGEYLNAATALLSYPLPQDNTWKARFLLYRIQMAKQTSSLYNRILEEREIDDEEAQTNPELWTRAQWHKQIFQDYETLWTMREHLLKIPTEQETLILTVKDTDLKRIPTLFDFVIQSYTSWLETRPSVQLPKSPSITYLEGQATPAKETKNLANKYASLLQQGYLLEGKNRQNARLFWQTDFTLLPLEHKNWFDITDEAKARQTALTELYNLSGFSSSVTNWWKKLTQNLNAAAYGRSYAAYQAAHLLFQNEDRAQALQLCEFDLKLDKNSFTQQCENLIHTIQTPQFSFQYPPQALIPTSPRLPAKVYNLPKVYGRIYPVSFQELQQLAKERRERDINRWEELLNLSEKNIQKILRGNRPHQTFSQEIAYEKPYTYQDISLELPSLTKGLYVVLTSGNETFDATQLPLYARVINITDLALFATAAIEDNPTQYIWTLSSTPRTYTPNIFRFYTVNLKTGEMQPNTALTLITDWNGAQQKLTTDSNGKAVLARSISVKENDSSSYFADALAQQAGQYALLNSPIHFHFSTQTPLRLFAQTDRAIYRPEQEVQLSVNAFKRTVNGWEVWDHTPLALTVKDPNYKTVFSTDLTTDAMGTAQTKFTLPDGNSLLGTYTVQLLPKDSRQRRSYDSSYSFRVEEYKRPDYELTLEDLKTPLVYGKSAEINGQALYYTGAPLQKGTVKYTVTKQSYIPLFYWWYFRPAQADNQVAQGEVTTDEKGQFKFSFTPQTDEKDEQFARYLVQADVYDESGRPITATHTYQISKQPLLFKASFSQGFFDAGTELSRFLSVDLTDINGTSSQGKVQVKIVQLQNQLPTEEEEFENYRPYARPTLEKWYQNTPQARTVSTQELSFKKDGPQFVSLPALSEGIYRVTLMHPQADEQSLIFIVVKDGKTLQLPSLTLPQQSTYHVGETARILLGATPLNGVKQVEIYQGNTFLVQSSTQGKGVNLFTFPIEEKHRGGLAFSWFGTSDYKFYQGTTTLEIPFDNHELAVAWDTPDSVYPAQNLTLNATVKNNKGNPINGQASLTVYDASLDYYAAKTNPFTLHNFYPQNAYPADKTMSNFTSPVTSYSRVSHKQKYTSPLPMPSINLHMQRSRMYKGIMRSAAAAPVAGISFEEAEMDYAYNAMPQAASFAAARSMDAMDMKAAPESLAMGTDDTASLNTDTSAIRSDFAETAYFNTQIPVTNGKARVSFKMPDSLTKWNLLGFVLSKEASLGTFNLSTVSRKDFMVRLTLPRFYREGDKGIFQAAVTNLTNKKITVPVSLTIRQNGKNAAPLFGLQAENSQTVTVEPQGTAFASWNITAPHQPDTYQLSAVARLGKNSDGEQKDFLILPASTRVLATVNRALEQGTTVLTLDELQNDSSARAEIASLRVHPSLALSVLNSMPNLLNTRYNDLVSSLNRYVPLSIVHQFYTTYPQLKEAVKKLPKRTTLTAPWEQNDPLRLTLLEQTPWLQLAQGGQANQENIIRLFNDQEVKKRLDKEQKNLSKFQNASGAFSWIAGGPDDDYLTLYALNAFAQALAYNAPIPTQEAQKAFTYIVPRIEKRLKEDKEGSESTVSFALYAAYTLSAFPPQWPQMSRAKTYLQSWVDYADKQSRFMTPLGQIYAAAVYHRLGDDIKANAYLDKVLARLKENELTGAYFAPEAQSWVWYRDTLTTQTTTLRTLLEIRPKSDKIAPMLKWLLFNRQANLWDNAKAAAQAVFTVLDVMQHQGVLSSPVSYQIKWADLQKDLRFEPFDWTEDLAFTKTDKQISPRLYTATVTKQGGTTDFASLSVVYTTENAQASPKGVINVEREYFVRFTQNGVQKLRPLKNLEEATVGDEVEVHLTLTTDSAFEYVLVDDPKPAGFENADLISKWDYRPISFYREIKDSTTRFFINRLPAGKVTLRYELRPTVNGEMHLLPAQVQSMYAPEYGAHTSGGKITVKK